MRVHYSPDADAVYIRLKDDRVSNTDEITEDIMMDYNDKGDVIGIEILSVSEKADIDELTVQAFNRVKIEKAAVA